MAGTGDFNGDSKPDIVWNHLESGQLVLWFMNGSILDSGTFTTPNSISTDYRLVAVGDFSARRRTASPTSCSGTPGRART